MYSLNKAQIIGNVCGVPEVTETKSGSRVAQFSVATNRQWKNKDGEKVEDCEFHNVVLWGSLADVAEKYVEKGKKVYIEGRLQTRTWDDKDGKKCYKTEIVAENLILLSAKEKPSEETIANYVPQKKQELKKPKAQEDIKLEDIPF